MISLNYKGKDGTIRKREYECTPRRQIELCFANIECLLRITLADSDEHIRKLGGEETLLKLMFGYEELAEMMLMWEDVKGRLYDKDAEGREV